MTTSDGFTDSTDWLSTSLTALAPVDASLRCQVCKDFFTTPMITSCSHTFCSLCIRRYLSQEGRCPACRESDQEIKLRRNWSVEETVTQFKAGREELLKFAKTIQEQRDEPRPKKRRKIEHHEALPERRSTRSQSRKLASQDLQNGHPISSSQEEVQDSDDGSIYEVEPSSQQQNSDPHDGLVACPCCGRRMKEAVINTHLDKCMAGKATPSPPPASARRSDTPQFPTSSIAYNQSKAPTTAPERLPTINYSILTEQALRRKLKELGIPSTGSKELMRRRHTEWINLWNANCDSLRPVSKRQLLQDLDRWEKTLGRQVEQRGPTGVMLKEFDRGGWQKSNKGEFDDLIRMARQRRAAAVTVAPEDKVEDIGSHPSQTPTGEMQNGGPTSIEDIFSGAAQDGGTTNGDKSIADTDIVEDVVDTAMDGTTPVDAESSGAVPLHKPDPAVVVVSSGAIEDGDSKI